MTEISINQSPEVDKLFAAMAKAQAQLHGAKKDSSNPFFKSKYADLESVWDACRAALTSNGICVIQTTAPSEAHGTCIVTTLGHQSGQWIKGTLPIMAVKQDPQAMGSAITYSRRYSLAAIVGIVQTDDDAESAMRRPISTRAPEAAAEMPGQPPMSDGFTPSHYVVPFGKYAKRTLEEIDVNELRNYVDYLEKKAEKEGKPIQGAVAEFINRASDHIIAIESSNI